nr:MAG TPA: hypothetical protein [Caudoviricetes sp.]
MKYKVGDRVRLISKPTRCTTTGVEKNLGKVVTISGMGTSIFSTDYYTIEEDDDHIHYFEDTIAGLASEVPFDFDAWKGKEVCMHCKTEEEAKDFCREMDQAGLRWSSGTSYLKMSCFNIYENYTCYRFNEGEYDNTVHAKNKGYTILEWSDYRSTEPPKDEEQEKTMETKIDDKPLSFAEAMKIRKRLCTNMRDVCGNCPLSSDNNDTTESCDDFMLDHPDMAELILKEWMAEHPLKTNKDKFAEVFGEIEKFGKCKFAICSAVPCSRCDWWQQEYVEPYKEQE